MAFSTSGWTPALLSLAKLREGFMGQQFSRRTANMGLGCFRDPSYPPMGPVVTLNFFRPARVPFIVGPIVLLAAIMVLGVFVTLVLSGFMRRARELEAQKLQTLSGC